MRSMVLKRQKTAVTQAKIIGEALKQSTASAAKFSRRTRTLHPNGWDTRVELVVPEGSKRATGISKRYDLIVDQTGRHSGEFLYVTWSEANGLTVNSSFGFDYGFTPLSSGPGKSLDPDSKLGKMFLNAVKFAAKRCPEVCEFVAEHPEIGLLLSD